MSITDSKTASVRSTETASIDLTRLTVEKVQEGFRTGAFTAQNLATACFR